MLIYVLGAIAVVAAGFVLFVATRPAEFRIVRRTTVKAAPAAVFAEVSDLHRWEAWSPWAKRDPNMQTQYSGADSGVGSSYAWQGNKDVGEGQMTIEESVANERVRILLEFLKPFAATNTAEFVFKASGEGTEVEWSMTGRNGFVGKAVGLFMDMDKMVGNDFETGLRQLKGVVEG